LSRAAFAFYTDQVMRGRGWQRLVQRRASAWLLPVAVIAAACGLFPMAAAAAPPAAPVFLEPTTDGEIVNPADVHMEAEFSDPDGDSHFCTDWQIVTAIGEVVWDAPCLQGLEKVHCHLGDGVFVNSLAGKTQLDFDSSYKVHARFHDGAGEIGPWADRPFQTSPEGPPGVPGAIPWTARQPGYQVEIVASGFQLPVNIAFVPNPGNAPDSPLMYVTELWGKIKVIKRDGSVSDYATGLLNFNPLGAFPGAGEQGLSGVVVDPANGDVIASMLYEDTASTVDPKPHYPKVVRFHSTDGGRTAATQTVLLDMFGESQGQSHFISNTSIGPDGKLYQHMGDGYAQQYSQNLNWYRGKILRMNMDGSAPSDNPFYNAGDGINARDYVYAYGFRNPFGGAWRAADGSHYEVENGRRVDRFAKVVPGRNYLWDGYDPSMTNYALYNWDPSHAPVNIAFIQPQTWSGSGFPFEKMDHAFVSEHGPHAAGPQDRGKRIVEFAPNASGTFDGVAPVPLIEYTGTGRSTAAGLTAGPDGLYFTDLYKDQGTDVSSPEARVLRVRYVGAPGYPRPKGASPLRVPLVPAFNPCTAPNRTHGPSLEQPSCAPPTQASSQLTIGTADANGKPTASSGLVRLTTRAGDPATPADEADVALRLSVSDVRNKADLSDYTGEIQANLTLRITDRTNGPSTNELGTTDDLSFPVTAQCVATAGTNSPGSDCDVVTTADALAPGAIKELKRTVWQVSDVQVYDGGADGDVDTTPNTLFMRQGIFVP
jgi:glucose/arabinose dehydrogenase